MPKIETVTQAFNTGVFDRDKLHRTDIPKVGLAASRQTNFLSDSIGRGFMRPGFEHIVEQVDEEPSRLIPFLNGTDGYVIECSGGLIRVHVPDDADGIITYDAVGTDITSGVASVISGTTSSWTSGSPATGGEFSMLARAHGATAKITLTSSAPGADANSEHVIRVDIERGPIEMYVSTAGGYLVTPTTLETGVHYLAFTPLAAFTVVLTSSAPSTKTGTIEIYNNVNTDDFLDWEGQLRFDNVFWNSSDVRKIRTEQSLDVMWFACDDQWPKRLERRGSRSWSFVDYETDDGPFDVGRSANVKLKASVREGNGTLTADANFFQFAHIGTLFRLDHPRQTIDTYVAGDGAFTDAFKVTGITETNYIERQWDYTIAGTWAGTLRVYRSLDGEFGEYHQVPRASGVSTIDITANASYTNDDNEDNLEVWYKIGFEDNAYTSGEAHITITYPNGKGYGICRVTDYTSETVVNMEVLRPFKATRYTDTWRQGRWSEVGDTRPTSVALSDGRLVWAGEDLFDASVSDAYSSFDETVIGDAGPISRSIAVGGRNKASWMLGVSPLVIGCDSRVAAVQASSLDEVLSPSNFKIKNIAKLGAAAYSPCELTDGRILFAHGTGIPFEMVPSDGTYTIAPYSALARNLVTAEKLVADMIDDPHATDAAVVEMAVQHVPDQRVWAINSSGRMVCILDQPEANVLAAHIPVETTGTDIFGSVCVIPIDGVDRLYVSVKRGSVWHTERLALDVEALPGTVCKVMDSFVSGGAHSETITGLSRLDGREVVAWVDGEPLLDEDEEPLTFTVTGGSITLPDAPAQGYCVGLPYDVQYQSARLGAGIPGFNPLLKNKSVAEVGFLLADYVRSGFKYGTTSDDSAFSAEWNLPAISTASGTTADEIVVGPAPDETKLPAGSALSTDTRLCFAGASPRPFSVLAIVMAVQSQ